MKFKQVYQENKRVFLFCARAILLLVLFSFLNRVFFEPSGVHQWLIDVLGKSSTGILALFGYNFDYSSSLIYHNNEGILEIGSTCDGLSFIILFFSFVLAYPASNTKGKILFIFIGTLTIHLLNTIRTTLLVLNFTFNFNSFDFNHKYTFVVIVYGIVLWMWVVWAKKNAAEA